MLKVYSINKQIISLVQLKNNTNPFELVSKISEKLQVIWQNRSKKMIKDRNYLKQKEILKNVGKLLKKEDYLGNINYDRTIHYNIYL